MKKDSVLWLLSLSRKAGKAEVGAFLSERAIKSGRAVIVIAARDCSDNTKKKFKNSSEFYGLEYYEYSDMAQLAGACGKENVSVIAICDENFASGIKAAIMKQEECK